MTQCVCHQAKMENLNRIGINRAAEFSILGRKGCGFPHAEKAGKEECAGGRVEVVWNRQVFTPSVRATSQSHHARIPAPVVQEVSKTVSDGLMRSAFARRVAMLQFT